MKYFLSQLFMVETGDDPENDGANPSYVKKTKVPNTLVKIIYTKILVRL